MNTSIYFLINRRIHACLLTKDVKSFFDGNVERPLQSVPICKSCFFSVDCLNGRYEKDEARSVPWRADLDARLSEPEVLRQLQGAVAYGELRVAPRRQLDSEGGPACAILIAPVDPRGRGGQIRHTMTSTWLITSMTKIIPQSLAAPMTIRVDAVASCAPADT